MLKGNFGIVLYFPYFSKFCILFNNRPHMWFYSGSRLCFLNRFHVTLVAIRHQHNMKSLATHSQANAAIYSTFRLGSFLSVACHHLQLIKFTTKCHNMTSTKSQNDIHKHLEFPDTLCTQECSLSSTNVHTCPCTGILARPSKPPVHQQSTGSHHTSYYRQM